MSIHVGTFPAAWTVDPDDFRFASGSREFALKGHITPGMGSEVMALVKSSGGQWVFSQYIDDYVDGHWAAQGSNLDKYMTWFVGELNKWLAKTFVPGTGPSGPGESAEPIEKVCHALGRIKIAVNADGTLTASL